MSAVPAHQYNPQCDCNSCGCEAEAQARDSERADELRTAILRSSSFIGDAFLNTTGIDDLVAAAMDKSGQAALDAMDCIVSDYLAESVKFQLQRKDVFAMNYPRSELAALENIAHSHGVKC